MPSLQGADPRIGFAPEACISSIWGKRRKTYAEQEALGLGRRNSTEVNERRQRWNPRAIPFFSGKNRSQGSKTPGSVTTNRAILPVYVISLLHTRKASWGVAGGCDRRQAIGGKSVRYVSHPLPSCAYCKKCLTFCAFSLHFLFRTNTYRTRFLHVF